jgi:diguanylate cyclase (GGDEF)-like protein/PAS domain S-box-containing protein
MKSSSSKEVRSKVKALEQETRLESSILETIQDLFYILDQKGKFLKANPRGIDILGFSWEELSQKVLIDVVVPEDHNRINDGFEEMRGGREIRFRTSLISRSGERIPAEVIGTLRKELFFVTLRDLRERLQNEEEWERTKKELMEKVRERDQYARELQAMKDAYKEKLKELDKMREEALILSYMDDLTALCNHRYFIQELTKEIHRQKRYPSPLSLLMIDIDYFKNYNDTNGHLAGDQVLKTIAMIILHCARQTDIVARYGGEEFCAILINTGREGALAIAERVRKGVIEMQFPNENVQPNGDLTVSIGMATYSSSVSTVTDLIREADNALYRAKRAGRNRIEG